MERYSLTFKVIHLLSGLLLFGLLILGYYMVGLDDEQQLIAFYEAHKSIGVLLLGVIMLRLSWRILFGIPKRVKTHTRFEKVLSRSTHLLLYVFMFAMPVSGWLMSNAAGFSVPFFGLFDLPNLIEKNENMMNLTQLVHKYIALGLLTIVALHIVGALKHHFVDHDETLKRITYSRLGLSGGALIAIFASILWITPLLLWSLGPEPQGDAHAAAHDSADEAISTHQGH